MYRGEANQAFSSQANLVMSISLLIAVLAHAGAAKFSPPYAPTPYQLREKRAIAVDVPDDFEIPPPPEEIARPTVPSAIEESEEASEEETIAPTDFDPFEPPEIQDDDDGGDVFFAFDSPPTAVRSVAAEYPELARKAEAEGKVRVMVTINETGRVIDAKVVESSVIPSLERAAIDAAKQWLFKPAKQRDKPVKCRIVIPFVFSLSG